jgi:hypothetical protein
MPQLARSSFRQPLFPAALSFLAGLLFFHALDPLFTSEVVPITPRVTDTQKPKSRANLQRQTVSRPQPEDRLARNDEGEYDNLQ